MRSAPGAHPGRETRSRPKAFRRTGRAAPGRGDPGTYRRRAGDRHLLPLGLALRAGHTRASLGRLHRAQLRRLVARVVAPRGAAARAVVTSRIAPLLLVAVLAGCGTTHQTQQATRGPIVATKLTGELALYRIDARTGRTIRLSPGHDARDSQPACAPDGRT